VGKTLMAAQYPAEIIEETAHVAFVRDTLTASHGKTQADLPQYGTAAEARAAG
jgi:L-fuculose-phosphate aldolase/L-ribulose-5-phosphate 4-epimerase